MTNSPDVPCRSDCSRGRPRTELPSADRHLRVGRLLAAAFLAWASWQAAVVAAPPKRFLDTLLQRQEPPPKFIPVPKPPPVDPADVGRRRPPAGAIAGFKVPSWTDTVAFGTSLTDALGRAGNAALDPAYTRKPVLREPGTAEEHATRDPSGPAPPRSRRLERLRIGIARTLAAYQRRPLNTAQHSPWEVMHGFIAFGIPTQLRVGGPAGTPVNSIGWMNTGGRCRGQVMMVPSDDHPTALLGIGVQGHSAQYLAILAQCRVSRHSPITLQSRPFTVADLVEEEKLACKTGTELTFALIALAHYLPTEAEWTSRDGERWSLPRLMEEEIEQPIRGAACGGTHRLFGLAYGCQRRLRATGRLDGVYVRADKYVRDYQSLALSKLQNRDGSFSTEWFKYPADREDDIDRKVQTTGHILEWLVASLDQRDLYSSRVLAAVEFLNAALAKEPGRDWKIGPLGHALHALNIYQERVWGVVLPGGIAAFQGPMKALPPATIADRPDGRHAPKTVR